MDSEAFGFVVEWYDAQADLMREYSLTVYMPQRGPLEVAMYDQKSKRSFLKRVAAPELRLDDLCTGSVITIYGRQLKVRSYSDEHTRREFEARRFTSAYVTSAAAFRQLGRIIGGMETAGLSLSRLRLVNDGGPVVALQVVGESAAERRWDATCASLPAGSVRKLKPEELGPYFDAAKYPCTAAFDHCTLCVIRPHAVRAGNVGAILSAVLDEGLEISAAQMMHLKRPEASELLEVYKGVLPYHAAMVDGLCSAPCIALELRAESDVVERLRKLCGPHDVDMARHLRPESLRARFGLDNAQNGVHATDLEDDGELEVQYVFKMLGA